MGGGSDFFGDMQVYELSTQFLPKDWIMEKWEEGFYITAMAGSASSSSMVVMSKGTPYTQQSYKVMCSALVLSPPSFQWILPIPLVHYREFWSSPNPPLPFPPLLLWP